MQQFDLEDAAAEFALRGNGSDSNAAVHHVSWDKDADNGTTGCIGGNVLLRHRPTKGTSLIRAEDYGPNIPSNATIFVYTFGCGHNVSDGEYMAGLLSHAGYRITDEFEHADAYVINSCTVKNPSEEHFINMMNRVRRTGKPLVVAGCVPQADPANRQWDDVSVIGVTSIDRVVPVVAEALQGNHVRLIGADAQDHSRRGGVTNGRLSRTHSTGTSSSFSSTLAPPNSHRTPNGLPLLDLPKIRRNRYIEILPINVGCLNHCTYCKTKQARGDLRSWAIQDIVHRVQMAREEGVLEIRLTSEDVGAYGIDLDTNVVELLRAVLPELEGTRIMLRIGMSNPPYLLRQVDDVAAILHHPNVYAFVHIPVQSGSNRILEAMKREYTVDEFEECVERIRAVVPDVSVATDIICAFPGEGEPEWQETVALCERMRFPVINMTRFYPRRDTPAAAMKQIPTQVAKQRTTFLTELFNSYRSYDHLLGTVHTVTLLEVAHDKHHLVGHTKAYVQVLVSPEDANIGETVPIIVTETSKFCVHAQVIRGRCDLWGLWGRLITQRWIIRGKTAVFASRSLGGFSFDPLIASGVCIGALVGITVMNAALRRIASSRRCD